MTHTRDARRSCVPVTVDGVTIGGQAPIAVQSMTNTLTADVDRTVMQVQRLADAGSDLVRITVDTEEAASAVGTIRRKLDATGYEVPLIGDFHYNGHRLLAKFPDCAASLSKYRINPGNVGQGAKRDIQFAEMISIARRHRKPIRIGVNWGSLDQNLLARLLDDNAALTHPRSLSRVTCDALVTSAIESACFAEHEGLAHDAIVLSAKVSSVQDLIAVYRDLATGCDYPLHLGLTEAGMGDKGVVSSTTALAVLLQEGIGDTIRISLTPDPGGDRCREVRVAQEILQNMGIRSFTPQVIACPGCGRTSSDVFQHLAQDIERHLRSSMPRWQRIYPGVEELSVAVMGCVVNGPGESRHADIGISLPGNGERSVAPVYENGKKTVTLKGDDIADQFKQRLEQYVIARYGQSGPTNTVA